MSAPSFSPYQPTRSTAFAAAPARTRVRRSSPVGGHQFGHNYNGPIGLVLTLFHYGLHEADLP